MTLAVHGNVELGGVDAGDGDGAARFQTTSVILDFAASCLELNPNFAHFRLGEAKAAIGVERDEQTKDRDPRQADANERAGYAVRSCLTAAVTSLPVTTAPAALRCFMATPVA